jgi:hypothetical protein
MSTCQEMVVIIRPSFKKFCGQDACRAALFNQLLYWIARRAKGREKASVQSGEVYWYGTAEEICAGLDDSWSINKVRKEIKALVDAGLIGQRRNPVKGWDQTRHYFIGLDQGTAIREACGKYGICLLHLGLRPDVLHLLNMVNAFDTLDLCSCQIDHAELPNLVNEGDKNGHSNYQTSEMHLPKMVDAPPKNGNAIPEDTVKVSSKDNQKEEKEPSPSLTHPSDVSSQESPNIPANEPNIPANSEDVSQLDQLRFWLKELKIHGSKDPVKASQDLASLVPHIHSINDLKVLYTYTEKRIYGENKTVFLGNVAGSVQDWIKSQIPLDTEAQQGLLETDLGDLEAEIKREYPMFVMHLSEVGHSLALWYGPNDYMEVRDSVDWQYWREDKELMGRAVAYGESVAQKRRVS